MQNLIDLTKIKNRLTSLGVKKKLITEVAGSVRWDNLVSFNDMMELIEENTIYSLKDSQTLRVNKNLDSSKKIFDELNFI